MIAAEKLQQALSITIAACRIMPLIGFQKNSLDFLLYILKQGKYVFNFMYFLSDPPV